MIMYGCGNDCENDDEEEDFDINHVRAGISVILHLTANGNNFWQICH